MSEQKQNIFKSNKKIDRVQSAKPFKSEKI